MFVVGARVKKIRQERGLSQRELADRVGVSQSMISQIEHGVTPPSLETLDKIADVLRVSKSAIYDEKVMTVDNLFYHFDERTKEFLVKEESIPYVVFAKELVEAGLTPEDINAIREAIKNILCIRNSIRNKK